MNNDDRQRYTLRLPTALFQTIEAKADKIGVSTNAMILQILWEWLKQNPDPPETA